MAAEAPPAEKAEALPKPQPRKRPESAQEAAPAAPARDVKPPTAFPADRVSPADDQWRQFWTDRRAAVAVAALHNGEANLLQDPRLKAGSGTVNFLGPALGATMRAMPVGEEATGMVATLAANWVPLMLGALILFELLRVWLALRRRAQAEKLEAQTQAQENPAFHLVGNGRI